MSMLSTGKDLIMKARGFEKIGLKGNRFKYEKFTSHLLSPDKTEVVFSNGKKITELSGFNTTTKTLTRPNGDTLTSISKNDGTYKVYKNGQLLRAKTAVQVAKERSEKIAQKTQEYINSLTTKIAQTKTGKEVIMKFNKNNKLIAWSRPADDLKVKISRPLGLYQSEKVSAAGEIIEMKTVAKLGDTSAVSNRKLDTSAYPIVNGHASKSVYQKGKQFSSNQVHDFVANPEALFEDKEALKTLFSIG